jgi:hypothetical protein
LAALLFMCQERHPWEATIWTSQDSPLSGGLRQIIWYLNMLKQHKQQNEATMECFNKVPVLIIENVTVKNTGQMNQEFLTSMEYCESPKILI